jgi:hypothetical protein
VKDDNPSINTATYTFKITVTPLLPNDASNITFLVNKTISSKNNNNTNAVIQEQSSILVAKIN